MDSPLTVRDVLPFYIIRVIGCGITFGYMAYGCIVSAFELYIDAAGCTDSLQTGLYIGGLIIAIILLLISILWLLYSIYVFIKLGNVILSATIKE